MTKIYNEEFLKISNDKIKEIVALEKAGKKTEALKAELDFANFKVNYYEQFFDPNMPTSDLKRIYEDDLTWALLNRANVRDKCMDAGIFEDQTIHLFSVKEQDWHIAGPVSFYGYS